MTPPPQSLSKGLAPVLTPWPPAGNTARNTTTPPASREAPAPLPFEGLVGSKGDKLC